MLSIDYTVKSIETFKAEQQNRLLRLEFDKLDWINN